MSPEARARLKVTKIVGLTVGVGLTIITLIALFPKFVVGLMLIAIALVCLCMLYSVAHDIFTDLYKDYLRDEVEKDEKNARLNLSKPDVQIIEPEDFFASAINKGRR